MCMDGIKLFAKYEKKKMETLIHAVRIYSENAGMEFVVEKCAMQVMKSGKRHLTDGMELPNHDKLESYSRQNSLAETLSKEYLSCIPR